MNNHNQQILEVIEYSETMLKHAESGDWDKVIDLEVQRNVLLEKLFSTTSASHEIDNIDNKIHQILNINQKIESFSTDVRNDIQEEINTIAKGRRAVDFYAQTPV